MEISRICFERFYYILAKFFWEDSLGVKPKPHAWNKRNLRKMDLELEKLSKLVKSSINIKAIERLVK